jgi:hypothetical protein
MAADANKPEKCELCSSNEDVLDFHHLIPRTLHGKKQYKKLYSKLFMATHGIWICKEECHPQIHEFITEKEMGAKYNTLDKLKEHPEIKKYLEWRSKRVN